MSAEPAQEPLGRVFDVQRYSIHDGPGIRTTVFLKGCPLTCAWCQNPESQHNHIELFFLAEKCKGCGTCVAACPKGAIRIEGGISVTDRSLCDGSGLCVQVCPNDARSLVGRKVTPSEIFEQVSADAIFYEQSGGGVTLSGGEPLSQSSFCAGLLSLCREAGYHTAVETCGQASWGAVKKVIPLADLVLFDLKHMDPVEHSRHTGVSNERIQENMLRIRHELGKAMIARVPVVPGYNDSAENIGAVARFVAEELDTTVPVNLIPYHRLGNSKLERLGRSKEAREIEPPTRERLAILQDVVRSFGLEVSIGG